MTFTERVAAERERQTATGKDAEDRDHSGWEWCGIVLVYAGRAAHAVTKADLETARAELVKLAAICNALDDRIANLIGEAK